MSSAANLLVLPHSATICGQSYTREPYHTLADRMRKPEDELKLVIVCDMWLTGFDVHSLHTLYIDKPMKGHNLMQAITSPKISSWK